MKEEPCGDRVFYTIEGVSRNILEELWTLYRGNPRYPLSIVVAGNIVEIDTERDLLHFFVGLQVGIEMNMI